jgi:hypothetical protein
MAAPVLAREMSLETNEDRAMHHQTYVPYRSPYRGAAQFNLQQGERWRRFLERVGTRSNDFSVRLFRARYVYLHRRDTGTHWLPL